MDKKGYNVKVIGTVLTILYAAMCCMFMYYLSIPALRTQAILYVMVCGVLLISSVSVIMLNEWGRKLLIWLNVVIILIIALYYIPRINYVHLVYLIVSAVMLMYFTLPKVKHQFDAQKYQAWHKSILVIDDDETLIKTLRPILLSHGYSVLTASTGEDGLRIARMQKPDMILLDVILPGIKGREVCKRLKEDPETQETPIVFLTAKNSPDDIEAEKSAGAIAHITKPVNAQILLATVKDVLKPSGTKTKS